MEDDLKAPEGYTKVAEFEGGEVWTGRGRVVVLASLKRLGPGEKAEFTHNCDQMGCSSQAGWHVVWTGPVLTVLPPPPDPTRFRDLPWQFDTGIEYGARRRAPAPPERRVPDPANDCACGAPSCFKCHS